MSNSVRKPIEIFLVVVCCVLLLDRLLPVERSDNHVHHLIAEKISVAYIVALTGGEMATCEVPQETIQALKPSTEIVVTRSFLFGRCVDVSQVLCHGIVCFNEPMSHINQDEFVRNALRYAYGDKHPSIESLSRDHLGYSPEIRRWPDIRGPWTRIRYSVRLPETVIILDKEGKALTSRKCGAAEGLCVAVPGKRSPQTGGVSQTN